MARLEQYRHFIQLILTQYAQIPPAYGATERQIIFDTERDHYQLVNIGWENHRRVYGCLIHIDIQAEKIWVQYDGTEAGVANQLVELGVPKQDMYWHFNRLLCDNLPSSQWAEPLNILAQNQVEKRAIAPFSAYVVQYHWQCHEFLSGHLESREAQ